MAYAPDPTDVTQPLDSVFASTAAAEFRALKTYIQGLVVGGGQLSGNRSFTRNGSFLLNQRAAGAVTTDGAYVVDGWRLQNTGTNRIGGVRDTASHPAVFPQTLLLQINTPGTPAAGEVYGTYSATEGYNVAQLLYGTASARSFTRSFKVFSSQAGTFAFSARNNGANRSYVTPITINTANTWETKTVTIPGDIAGAWNATNLVGIQTAITIGCGATYSTATPNTWIAGNFVGLTTQTNFVGTAGAFFIAEVQDEPGGFANAFEYLPFASALLQAQRYWQTSYEYGVAAGTASSTGSIRAIGVSPNEAMITSHFPVTMRTIPSMLVYNTATGVVSNFRNVNTGAALGLSTALPGNSKGFYTITSTGAVVSGQVYEFQYTADADL